MARPKINRTPKGLFGKRIKHLFGDSNFSSFEKKYGLSIGQIGKFIDGAEPRLSSIEAIVKGTGCNAAWLLIGEGEPFGEGMDKMNDTVLMKNLKLLRVSCTKRDFQARIGNIGERDGGADWLYFEAGSKVPTDAVIRRIAGYFEVSPDDLKGTVLTAEKYPHLIPLEGEWEGQGQHDNSAPAKAIYRLQKAISEIQIALAEVGLHVASGQSLKDYADLNPLLNNLQVLELPLQALVGILKAYQQPDVVGSSPLDGGDLDGAAS